MWIINSFKMNIRLITVISLVYLSLGINAQEKQYQFSLQEAQDFALQNNKTLLNAKSEIQIADAQIREAKGRGLPQVEGTVDYMTNFNYAFSLNFGGAPSTPPQIDFSKLDEGDLEVLKLINGLFEPSAGPAQIIMEDQANASLQISQLIFSGQYWAGIQLAKIAKKIASSNVEVNELDTRQNVINSYYLILVTRKWLDILDETQDNLKAVMKHTSDMVMAGMAEQTDADQFRVSLSQLENSKNAMQRNHLLNYNTLHLFLGIDPKAEITLTDDLETALQQMEEGSLLTTDFDITANPGYKIVEAQQEVGEKSIDLQKWAYAPTLVGFYSYREKLLTTSFDLSPKNAAGLTLSVPIYSGGTKRAQVSKAKIELDKINRSKSLLEEQLSLQENQLKFNLKNALENYQTQKDGVDVAKRVYESTQNKYKMGMLSSLDLTQANTNYLQAENNYFSSVLQMLQSKLELDKLYNNF